MINGIEENIRAHEWIFYPRVLFIFQIIQELHSSFDIYIHWWL